MFSKIKSFFVNNKTFFAFFIPIFIITLFINTFVLGSFVVNGHSMDPTLKDGEMGIALKISRNYNYGDIVIAKGQAEYNKEYWVKRVIAKPGDTVYCKNNIVYVNNKKIKEDYLQKGTITEDFDVVKLKNDEYFLMGDNRQHSTDSRVFGPFKEENIKDKWLFGIL